MFRKIAVMFYKVRFRLLQLNLTYDKVKEPWRFLISLLLVAPCFFGLSAHNYSIRYVSIIYLIALVTNRMYWRRWAQKHFGDNKS